MHKHAASKASIALTAVASVTALLLSGCGADSPTVTPDTGTDSSPTAKAPDPALTATPELSVLDGAAAVNPASEISATTSGNGLETVTLVNEDGYHVQSHLSEDGKAWTAAEPLGYGRTYTLTATERNGKTATATFTTVSPAATNTAYLSPIEGAEVGVAQVVEFNLGAPVVDRRAVEEAIEIKTTPAVEGAFYWQGDNMLRWRPKDFWQPGTQVEVRANLYGKDLGGGVFGETDTSTSFTIGDEVLTKVNDATKTMSVYRNGELLREIPVSLGRDAGGWATPNGVYRVGDMREHMVMDSMTYGLGYDEGGYQTPVNYATQMSWSGIYIHGAPWSVWAQGNTNTSHGCINVTDEAAAWFQSVAKTGDPIIVENTVGGQLHATDGLGDWNYSWEDLQSGQAGVA